MSIKKRVVLTVPKECKDKTRKMVARKCWHSQLIVENELDDLCVKIGIYTYDVVIEDLLFDLRNTHIAYTCREEGNGYGVKQLRFDDGGKIHESPQDADLSWDGQGKRYLEFKLIAILLK